MSTKVSLVKIWNLDSKSAEAGFKELIISGREIKTESSNPHIKLLSCCLGYENNFFSELENSFFIDDFFLRMLEKAENDGFSHDDIFLKAIQESSNRKLDRIIELQLEAKRKKQEQNTLLENTYNEKMEEICPLNPHDNDNNFYSTNANGERELLKPHHIFHHKGSCYDIDTIFHYVIEGGQIDLDINYVKRFFDKNGKVDMSNKGMTDNILRNKTYHENVKVLDLSHNNITNLTNTHLPKTTLYINLDNNPIGDNYFLSDETPKLMFLSMRNCSLKEVNFQKLPESLTNVDLRDNKLLTGLYSLSKIKNIRRLDIRNTGIRKIDFSKFKLLDNNNKLTILCDKTVEFNRTKYDWITIEH